MVYIHLQNKYIEERHYIFGEEKMVQVQPTTS